MRLLVVAASPPRQFVFMAAAAQDRAPAAGAGIAGTGAIGENIDRLTSPYSRACFTLM